MFYKILDILRIVLTVLNLYLFMKIVLNTAVTFTNLAIVTAVFFVLGFLLYRWIRKDWQRLFGWFDFFGILIPLVFNAFFYINYTFSSEPEFRTYQFQSHERSTTIQLENGEFQDFYLLRTFPDYSAIVLKDQVLLHTETGFFGLLVLKDYQFSAHK